MARMTMARATRSKAPSKAPVVGGLPLHLDSVPESWVALVNVSREQIQGRGRGYITLLDPGRITGPAKRQCIQEVRKNAGLKMYENKKGALKVMSIKNGRKLRALAQALHKQGVRDAFFVALSRLFPDFRGTSEYDRAAHKRKMVAAKNLYKRNFGVFPPDEMSLADIMAKNRDKVAGAMSTLGEMEDFDMFADASDEPDIEAELESILREKANDEAALARQLAEADDEEEGDEPPEPAALRSDVQNSEEAKVAAIKKRLADEFGVRSFRGRPGREKLEQILAECISKANRAHVG